MNTPSDPLRRLYEPGAPATAGSIPLSVPYLHGDEWTAVKECLDSGWISSAGPMVERLEQRVAELCQAKYAVAVASGTAALHTALLVAGVLPGDEVITTALTFIAPVNAIRYVNAIPVFVDVDIHHWQIDPSEVETFLVNNCISKNGNCINQKTGRRIGALLPVHILGHPFDIDAIYKLAHRFGLAVIEDAAEGLGAYYRNKPVGHPGDLVCLSFNGNKVVTGGGGGMLLTDHAAYADRARYLTTQAKDDPVEYIHGAVGYNYRLNGMQAAFALAQLNHLEMHVAKKRAIAAKYRKKLANCPGLTHQGQASWAASANWLHTIRVHEDTNGISSRDLLRQLAAHGIQSRPLWQPMHLSPTNVACGRVELANAEQIHREALSLPSSVGLTDLEQEQVCNVIEEALRHCGKDNRRSA